MGAEKSGEEEKRRDRWEETGRVLALQSEVRLFLECLSGLLLYPLIDVESSRVKRVER